MMAYVYVLLTLANLALFIWLLAMSRTPEKLSNEKALNHRIDELNRTILSLTADMKMKDSSIRRHIERIQQLTDHRNRLERKITNSSVITRCPKCGRFVGVGRSCKCGGV